MCLLLILTKYKNVGIVHTSSNRQYPIDKLTVTIFVSLPLMFCFYDLPGLAVDLFEKMVPDGSEKDLFVFHF